MSKYDTQTLKYQDDILFYINFITLLFLFFLLCQNVFLSSRFEDLDDEQIEKVSGGEDNESMEASTFSSVSCSSMSSFISELSEEKHLKNRKKKPKRVFLNKNNKLSKRKVKKVNKNVPIRIIHEKKMKIDSKENLKAAQRRKKDLKPKRTAKKTILPKTLSYNTTYSTQKFTTESFENPTGSSVVGDDDTIWKNETFGLSFDLTALNSSDKNFRSKKLENEELDKSSSPNVHK